MSVERIKTKALKCIDEIYPSENTLNEGYFPVEDFIDEAVRWVVDVVPCQALGEGEALGATLSEIKNGVGTMTLTTKPLNGRIIYFNVADWARPVLNAIHDTHPRYVQQKNKVLRGNPQRPVVAIVEGRSKVEFYSTKKNVGDANVVVRYMAYDGDKLPEALEDITAWKLAEIVLTSMSDVQSAGVCAAKVNEHLQQLSL
jgi:hypothetical protein